MLNISDLLTPDRVVCNFHASSKKRVLEELSDLLAKNTDEMDAGEIFEGLIERERLGSTGLGHGVAIPHARLPGREKAKGAFIKLHSGVDFDSIDQKPADLLFALLVPDHFTDEHLDLLAGLARMFDSDELCRKLRQSDNKSELFDLLMNNKEFGDLSSVSQ